MTLPRNPLNIFSIVMKNITVGVKKTWFETGDFPVSCSLRNKKSLIFPTSQCHLHFNEDGIVL